MQSIGEGIYPYQLLQQAAKAAGRDAGLQGMPRLQQLVASAVQNARPALPIKEAFAEGVLACPSLDPAADNAGVMALWMDLQLDPGIACHQLLGCTWPAVDGRDIPRLTLVLKILMNCCNGVGKETGDLHHLKQLAQILCNLDAAAPGINAKALMPAGLQTLAAPISGSQISTPKAPYSPELNAPNPSIPAAEDQKVQKWQIGNVTYNKQAAAAEIAIHATTDNVAQLAAAVDELKMIRMGSNAQGTQDMLTASHVHMLELCSTMQSCVGGFGQERSMAKSSMLAESIYEDRIEYWSAMAPKEIATAVDFLCFGGKMPYGLSAQHPTQSSNQCATLPAKSSSDEARAALSASSQPARFNVGKQQGAESAAAQTSGSADIHFVKHASTSRDFSLSSRDRSSMPFEAATS
ncbi:hypothetical protein WJX74_002917 [Apatococcus lobatus]|uniref:Uncharacterized protein n=1 Tax=Apatococcus lobatus TaxID=904363 RepID=A0AAW1QVD5_9CHLO